MRRQVEVSGIVLLAGRDGFSDTPSRPGDRPVPAQPEAAVVDLARPVPVSERPPAGRRE